MDDEIITRRAEETAEAGRKMASALSREGKGAVLCLYGELGSGKTTFTQGFARGLGITSRLLSPTFIIVRRYTGKNISGFLYHVDLYRLDKKEDIEGLGLAEMLTDQTSFVLVEWAEKLGQLLPKNRIDVHFAVNTDGSHRITIRYVN
ncbi:tRNA (adenosine(37)-N6)-threonylcarbamoyltransferase complex ATPase subunit type 1 TsaE [Candidatus Gottesmanbacteria bacterium]|nr:tRNA (adenosine(37)-N6)-threonylcarbamoyltransferase complex ATPase subunit type 1 TsaE [Candidatus Gottesmanbacteria bacterium]